MNGRPLFDLIVCPQRRVGCRTQLLVGAALKARRTVLFADGLDLFQVAAVVCEDSEDWARGWVLVTAEGVTAWAL